MYINVHCTYKYYQPLSTECELDCSPIELTSRFDTRAIALTATG